MRYVRPQAFAVAAVTLTALGLAPAEVAAQAVTVGTAGGFAILAGTTITNTGATVITGDLGLAPGTATTGFTFSPVPDNGPGVVIGGVNIADGVAVQAKVDLVTAYLDLAGRPTTVDLTGQDLGGLVLTAGVYNFDTSAGLNGTLTLDAEGNPNALFIIDIDTTLTTGAGSSVVLINGAQAGNVFFRVGSSATLGTTTSFNGQIAALTSITLTTGANILCGAAWAQNGAVTLDTNTITVCPLVTATIGDVIGPDATDNQDAIGDAITAYAAGNPLPAEFLALLAFLTPAELAAVLTQLTGETATGVAATATRAMSEFMQLTLNPLGEERPVTPVPVVTPPPAPSNTISVMGYAAFDGVGIGPFGAPAAPTRSVWAAGYGGVQTTQGDAGVGSHDRFDRVFGGAFGIDFYPQPGTTLGIAVGGGATAFTLADYLGGGSSRILQAALHARTEAGAAYVAAVLAYGWHHIVTERSIVALDVTELVAEFNAHAVGGQIEAGYRLGGDRTSLTPYASAQVQAFFSPAYSETAVTGSPVFALSYEAQTTISVHTELGARLAQTFPLDGGGSLVLHSRFAWAHDYRSSNGMTAEFVALPGSTFTVEGAAAPANSFLVSAGADVNFAGGFSIAATYSGEFAPGGRAHGVTGELRFTW